MSGDSPRGIVRVCRRRPCCDLGPLTGPRIFFKGTTNIDFAAPEWVTDHRRRGCFFGVDFWHAVEFSRNGRFLRCGINRALRAFRLHHFLLLVFLVFRFRFSSLAHRFGGFAFLAFGFHRVSAFSASRTLADLPTGFRPTLSAFETLVSSASGSSRLADPFSRLARPARSLSQCRRLASRASCPESFRCSMRPP